MAKRAGAKKAAKMASRQTKAGEGDKVGLRFVTNGEGAFPEFRAGDRIAVTTKIIEGDKVRSQVFEGVVIALKRAAVPTFTVRKISAHEVGVERIWPLKSPWIEKIEVLEKGRVGRSKLYYLRQRVGKAALKVKKKS